MVPCMEYYVVLGKNKNNLCIGKEQHQMFVEKQQDVVLWMQCTAVCVKEKRHGHVMDM